MAVKTRSKHGPHIYLFNMTNRKKYLNCNNINYNAHHISNLESILVPRKDFRIGRPCNKRTKYAELPQKYNLSQYYSKSLTQPCTARTCWNLIVWCTVWVGRSRKTCRNRILKWKLAVSGIVLNEVVLTECGGGLLWTKCGSQCVATCDNPISMCSLTKGASADVFVYGSV